MQRKERLGRVPLVAVRKTWISGEQWRSCAAWLIRASVGAASRMVNTVGPSEGIVSSSVIMINGVCCIVGCRRARLRYIHEVGGSMMQLMGWYGIGSERCRCYSGCVGVGEESCWRAGPRLMVERRSPRHHVQSVFLRAGYLVMMRGKEMSYSRLLL